MVFLVDKQTLIDLQIFGSGGQRTVYSLFNRTHTRGGALVLEAMFKYPFSDLASINKRSGMIQYFQRLEMDFSFKSEWFDTIEHYLENRDARTQLSMGEDTLLQKLKGYAAVDTAYQQITQGIWACIALLDAVRVLIEKLKQDDEPIYQSERQGIEQLLNGLDLAAIMADNQKRKLSLERYVYYDRVFRFQQAEQLRQLLAMLYDMDVYSTVGKVGLEKRLTFATAVEAEKNTLTIANMAHPAMEYAVPNTVSMDSTQHVLFLTGANMAGKSTFMKTLGITVFLAHMGFPVPATHMEFSVLDGLFTTINLADNMGLGYSHFYAEVLRVKTVARHVGAGKRLLVIVDELFRGTNVKDAYDATLAVTEAFAAKPTCFFVVSTHIIETGPILGERCPYIAFRYLPTHMEDGKPHYTYQIKEGITADRHGMIIIQNENILSILEAGKYDV